MTEATARRSYSGLTAEERDAQRRQRLLESALEIIGTAGYSATTIPRVCTQAKVSTRHFYDLYATKEDLFVDLYDRITADSYTRVAASLEASAGTPLSERVPAALLAYLDPMLKDARIARVAFVEIMGASARIETLRLSYRETLIEIVTAEGTEAAQRGEVTNRDWRFAALALVGALTAIVYDWALRGDRPSRPQLEAQLTDLAVTLLTRRSAPPANSPRPPA